MSTELSQIRSRLEFIYGTDQAAQVLPQMQALIDKWREKLNYSGPLDGETLPLDQSHVVMITYGDSIRRPLPSLQDGSIAFEGHTKEAPLHTLKQFADKYLQELVSTIHLLPCFPYTSDDGFSVADYRNIDPNLGNWEDVEQLKENFRLMYDLVLNHCSRSIEWFLGFLSGDPRYEKFFCTSDPDEPRLKEVFRPRALPLLHRFDCTDPEGNPTGRSEWVWTTFSQDQVDVNFANPKVMLEYFDIFLDYVARGAQIVRLDAIGFLWKELGTNCMHHPKTHAVVQLMRSLLKEVAPASVLLTETNVPHAENISYFGNGHNEAQMVYQFSLPPLTLNSFIQGNAGHLTAWAKGLPAPNSHFSFFNFLSSHDGIGMLPARGYLSKEEQDYLVEQTLARGGKVNYKSTPEGDIPYELNINYLDAIAESELPDELRAAKFLAAESILISMAGVPGIYVHSLLGSENWTEGMEQYGINRRINREKLDVDSLVEELEQTGSLRNLIYNGMKNMLRVRRAHKSFHPAAAQHIMEMAPEIFAFERGEENDRVRCLVNCSAGEVSLPCSGGKDLLTGKNFGGADSVKLEPYQVLWLAEATPSTR
ncbi:sugar phosphorylase [Candidatus Haliotispira prima]|uniref:Sugar phosphorylase n=1 Tax=Candidatus Haliotispira prima TaxID=3034016 RepID=A0ABY8MGU1_9SPIO|nr:sugar phosphorylase [Candidatus Haliotispira prima]